MTDLVRVELGKEASPGVWFWTCGAFALEGRSRQPLLDACRQIKPLLTDTGQLAGLFRLGRSEPDLTCSVAWGADHTVKEEPKVRFGKYEPHYRA